MPAPARRESHRLIVLGLLALTLAAYANSFDAGFALDNRALILQDPRLRAATTENLGLILNHTYWWPYAESGLYRPFTTLTYLFNYAVLGNREQAAGYHAFNLLLHALNVLLVYVLARRFVDGRWPPAAAAGLWAVHPALTESVTNIIGRSDLLAGAAILSGFWLYLKSSEATGFRRLAWLAGLAAVTTIGVFSKESAVAILGVLVLYELVLGRARKPAVLVLSFAAVQLPILVMWWVRSGVLAASPRAVLGFTDNPLVAAAFWQAKLTALTVLGRYVWLMLWPMPLSSDYSYAQIPLAHGSLTDWAAWLTLAATLAAAALLYRANRAAAFFLLFAFVNLVPVANLLFPIGAIMADRFLYLPALGLCACAVMAVCSRLPSRAAVAAVAIVAAAFAGRTYARNADWHDDLSLASADVVASPDSYKTHYGLSGARYESDPGHANIDAAIEEAEKSLSILDPLPDARNTPTVYRSAGGYYLVKGGRLLGESSDGKVVLTPASRAAYERSIQILERCLSIIAALRGAGLHPAFSEEADVRRMLSADYLRLSQRPQAMDAALAARRLDPFNPQMYWQLFNVLIRQEDAFEAATVLVEGGIATGDPSMRRELIRLYQLGLDTKGCAVDPASGALNLACETVHTQLCAAAAGLEQLSRESLRTDFAARLKEIPPLSGCVDQAR